METNTTPHHGSGQPAHAAGSVTDRIGAFVLENFLFGDGDRMPAPSDSLLQNEIIDSTGVLELIEFLEAEFGIEVEESETVPENLDSIANLSAFVTRKTA